MSTAEQAYELIRDLDDEQIGTLIVFIHRLKEQKHRNEGKPTVDSLRGALHRYAKPEATNLEEGAWERDIIERMIAGDESF